ncbi:MAG TPA: alanine/glycine:cation symporter family protein [Myxococcota bacterium]|nr:alanine/glycine:cation symporter family protein [Myxococcota bacterium]
MLRLLFAALLLCSSTAQAEEPTEEPSFFDKTDAAFAEHVVGPLASVLFFDIAFWDNSLTKGDGLGETVGDERVVDWSEDDGYVFQQVLRAPVAELEARVTGEIEVTDEVTWYLSRNEEGINVGSVLAQPTNMIDEESEPNEDGNYVIEGFAPFPIEVTVDEETGAVTVVEAKEIPLPDGYDIGSHVSVERNGIVALDGVEYVVDAIDGDEAVLMGASRSEDLVLDNPQDMKLPIVVVWLVLGAIFFTLRMNFINIRGFVHSLQVTAGKYDNPDDPGEISHFQALSSALSATVGLGNIAGVAVAVGVGGPGAVFWMICAGFLGMSSKFAECTLGQMYRTIGPDGKVMGGPVRYLEAGLKELGMGAMGKVLAVVFAIMCIGGSLGGGNMFQANQSYAAVAEVVPIFADYAWLYGLVLAGIVALVIIGGIKSIGKVAGIIVPVMCGIYVLASLWIVGSHAAELPAAFSQIIGEAFTPEAGKGGLIGVLIIGFQRAAFSNEAGIGSAAIAHSAASTDEPVREGIVALLGPFIDTIIVCTMTGLVVVITGAYKGEAQGVVMTSEAFGSVLSWFPLVLSLAVVLFAFSTMISWSYYGERCWSYLFGDKPLVGMIYKVVFLAAVFFGAVFNLGSVLDFSDLMVLGMAFPNILGVVLLSNKVRAALDDYWGRLKSGQMKVRK